MASDGGGADRRLFRRFVRWIAPILLGIVGLVWLLLPFTTRLDELALACLGRAPATLHSRWWSCRVLERFRAVPAESESVDGRPLLAALLARADADHPDDDIFNLVSRLAERGLPLDRYDRRTGQNALHDAILSGRAFTVAFLLVRGANPELPVGNAAGPPLAGEKPLGLVSRLLERDDTAPARKKAQTIADLLREANRAKREEQETATRPR